MQFTTALFALAAATAANAASDLGTWNVTIITSSAANGYNSRTVLADFASDAYADVTPDAYTGDDVIRIVCKYEYIPNANPRETSSCEPNTFSYEYDGASKLIQLLGTSNTWEDTFQSKMLTAKQPSRSSRTSRSPTP
jgi:hypothetical protein